MAGTGNSQIDRMLERWNHPLFERVRSIENSHWALLAVWNHYGDILPDEWRKEGVASLDGPTTNLLLKHHKNEIEAEARAEAEAEAEHQKRLAMERRERALEEMENRARLLEKRAQKNAQRQRLVNAVRFRHKDLWCSEPVFSRPIDMGGPRGVWITATPESQAGILEDCR